MKCVLGPGVVRVRGVRSYARVTRTTLTALMLASCNALFGIEEGRLHPSDASTAGKGGSAGAAGAGTAGSAGFDASSAGQDGSLEAGGARDAANDVSDATPDAFADSCPILNACGAARACWCNTCISPLEVCLNLGPCTAALDCIMRTDCARDVSLCQNHATTCPAHCSDVGQYIPLSLEPLRRISECAHSNPACGACTYDPECTQACPVFMPTNGEIVPGGCPPGGAECEYGRRRCECVDGAWACTG